MSDQFFTQPILNFPYDYPSRHWELDEDGQPTNRINEFRRSAKFVTPVPMPRKRKAKKGGHDATLRPVLFLLHFDLFVN